LPSTRERIAAKELMADPAVQRVLDQTRVDGIVSDFDENALGVITVNRRANAGGIHVIDGWHRRMALIAMDRADYEMECTVYEGLEKSLEAAMFRRLNNTRKVHPLDLFRVRVVEGDQTATELWELITSYGFTIQNGAKNNAFSAVTTAENIYLGPKKDQRRLALLRRAMDIIVAAWGTESYGVKGELLKGICLILERHGEAVDDKRLTAKLAGYPGGPRNLIGKSRGLRELRKGPVEHSVAEILVATLNERVPDRRKLPEWRR
jgi:hypothetical protein